MTGLLVRWRNEWDRWSLDESIREPEPEKPSETRAPSVQDLALAATSRFLEHAPSPTHLGVMREAMSAIESKRRLAKLSPVHEEERERVRDDERPAEDLAQLRQALAQEEDAEELRREKPSKAAQITLACLAGALAVAIVGIGALSMRSLAATGAAREPPYYAVPLVATGVALALLGAAWFKLKRRFTACVLIFGIAASTNIVFLSNTIPASAVATNDSTFMFRNTTTFNAPDLDMVQGYVPTGAGTTCPGAAGSGWTCTWASDTFTAGQSMAAGTATVSLYPENNVAITFRSSTTASSTLTTLVITKPAGVVDGDVLIAAITQGMDFDEDAATVTTPPTGWTLIRETAGPIGAAFPFFRHLTYRKVASGEPANYTWTFNSNPRSVGAIHAYSGVDNTTPIDAEGGQLNALGTAITAPSITTVTAGTMLVFSGSVGGVATTVTPAGGMTERTDVNTPFGPTLGTADEPRAATGATGTRVATAAIAGSNIGHLLALRPAARTCALTVDLLRNAAVLATGTANTVSPSGATLVTTTLTMPAVTFATGDRLKVRVTAPANAALCNARIHFDGTSVQSGLVTATIVPENVLALLLLALGLPVGLRRWLRHRRPPEPVEEGEA